MKSHADRIRIVSLLCLVIVLSCLSAHAGEDAVSRSGLSGHGPEGDVWLGTLCKTDPGDAQVDLDKKALREEVLAGLTHQLLDTRADAQAASRYVTGDSDAEGPWFKGWYTRITDEDGMRSIAVVGASQYLPGASLPSDGFSPGYLAVIVSDGGQTNIYEAFPTQTSFWDNRELVLDDPESPEWVQFAWYAEGYGTITNDLIDVQIPDEVDVQAALGDKRLPWNTSLPWLGPEGLMEFLPFIPLHWFVYSLGTDAVYTYTLFSEGGEPTATTGFGFAHQESNWGVVFPPAWVWAEGINADNTSQFALSGGELMLGGETLTTWLVGFHSPRVEWHFRPTIPGTVFVTSIDACAGSFGIVVKDSLRKLVITATAPVESFVNVSVPTASGFLPGAAESFSTTVTVRAYVQLPWFGDLLVDRRRFEGAALEFGANYMCTE